MDTIKEKSGLIKAFVFVAIAVILPATATYAYFKANVEGIESESTISVGGATLEVKYVGTQSINAEGILPGWSSKKYFYVDITNETGQEISFNVNLIVDSSNFYTTTNSTDSYLQYALYKCTSSAEETCTSSIVGETALTKQSGTEVVGTVKTSEKGKVYYALELKFPDTGASQSQTGTNGAVLTFSGHVTIDASGKVYEITPVSFADDDWATIAAYVKAKKAASASVYSVGSEKEVEIDMDGDGTAESYTVRIANNSHYDNDCKDDQGNSLDSKTACGFVVEFVDIVKKGRINSGLINAGGWPATEMRTYLNGTFKSKLPSDLQSVIIDTKVLSGHGRSDRNSERDDGNWESTDQLYLLSSKEVWVDASSNPVSSRDTAYNSTRQLDFYSTNKVTTSNYGGAVKKYNDTDERWFLRTAHSTDDFYFLFVNIGGSWDYYYYYIPNNIGVAPAFRIGENM